jgi:adenine specific DNA methylase Mod
MPTLDFKGKQFVYAHHLTVPFRQLNVDAKKSVLKDGKASLDGNLIIQGDNLHALKSLLPNYAGKVKCIYIDPPYNTGAVPHSIRVGHGTEFQSRDWRIGPIGWVFDVGAMSGL